MTTSNHKELEKRIRRQLTDNGELIDIQDKCIVNALEIIQIVDYDDASHRRMEYEE